MFEIEVVYFEIMTLNGMCLKLTEIILYFVLKFIHQTNIFLTTSKTFLERAYFLGT